MKICPDYFLGSYNQETGTVTCSNGSQIIFFSEGYDDDKELNRWKGLEVNGFLLEEANELQEVSFNKAIERAGSHIPRKGSKPPPLILLTCNPSSNWVKTLFYDRWVTNTLPEGWKYIPSKITDNPYIMADEKYVASLQHMPRYQYEVFVQGNWDIRLKIGGEFYKCFELDKHVAPSAQCPYNPHLALHISWDDNVNPYLPLGIFQLEGNKVTMIGEIAGITPANTIKAVCAEFMRRYPAHTAGLFIYGDATADKEDTKQEKGHSFYRIVMEALRDYNPTLRVTPSNPSVVMRGNFINTILEQEYAGITVTISESCHHTINDFVTLKEAADGTKEKETATNPATKIRYQKAGHFTDLFDYLITTAFAPQFHTYQRGGPTINPTSGKTNSKHSY